MFLRVPPERRAQDAIAEIHFLATPTGNYEWVFEADIKACFDEIDHSALTARVRGRIGDKRVLGLVKAFLQAGILTEEGLDRTTMTCTPLASSRRCRPTSPCLGWTSTSHASGTNSEPATLLPSLPRLTGGPQDPGLEDTAEALDELLRSGHQGSVATTP